MILLGLFHILSFVEVFAIFALHLSLIWSGVDATAIKQMCMELTLQRGGEFRTDKELRSCSIE